MQPQGRCPRAQALWVATAEDKVFPGCEMRVSGQDVGRVHLSLLYS